MMVPRTGTPSQAAPARPRGRPVPSAATRSRRRARPRPSTVSGRPFDNSLAVADSYLRRVDGRPALTGGSVMSAKGESQIRTTHTGSLPRPDDLAKKIYDREGGLRVEGF